MESIIKELWHGIRIPKEYCRVSRYYYSRYQAEQLLQTIPRTAKDSRKDIYRGTKRDLREVPGLLERVCKSIRSGDFQLRIQARHENRN